MGCGASKNGGKSTAGSDPIRQMKLGRSHLKAGCLTESAEAFAAADTDADCCYAAGMVYLLGLKNRSRGEMFLRRAAKKDSLPAMNALGYAFAKDKSEDRSAEAFIWFRRAADESHPIAMFNAGVMLSQGKGVSKSDEAAFRLFKDAAEADDIPSAFNVGNMYGAGRGTEVDRDAAMRMLSTAAEAGHCGAMNNFAVLGQRAAPGIAATWLRKAVDIESHPVAMCNLAGKLIAGSPGLARDVNKAVSLFKRAANAGNLKAQFNMGVLLFKGAEGIPRDRSRAVEWFQTAAEKGHAKAQFNLALSLSNGQGCNQDNDSALQWYRLAADQGHSPSQHNLAILLLKRGSPGDARGAFFWLSKAAKSGHCEAMNRLGSLFADGVGIEKSDTEAVRWFRKAADGGSVAAQSNIAYMIARGRGVPKKDAVEAVSWMRKAADAENAMGMSLLADALWNGDGCDRDRQAALALYKRGASAGSAYCDARLSVIFSEDQKRGGVVGGEQDEGPRDIPADAQASAMHGRRAAGAFDQAMEAAASFRGSDPTATVGYAELVIHGIGSDKNVDRGLGLCRQAAAVGCRLALLVMANAFRTEGNTLRAAVLYMEAIDGGCPGHRDILTGTVMDPKDLFATLDEGIRTEAEVMAIPGSYAMPAATASSDKVWGMRLSRRRRSINNGVGRDLSKESIPGSSPSLPNSAAREGSASTVPPSINGSGVWAKGASMEMTLPRLDSAMVRLTAKLGQGGFGRVLRGMWRKGGKEVPVAVKEVPIFAGSSIDSVLAEARTQAKFKHTHIVTLYGYYLKQGEFEGDDYVCLVMEYCSGGSLHTFLHHTDTSNSKKEMTFGEKVSLCVDIADGVHELHHAFERPIVHRDLKPANVLLGVDSSKSRIAKLADFGLSRAATSFGSPMTRMTGGSDATVAGTHLYMSPETSNGKIGTAADIYALGIILWEIFSGEVPYRTEKVGDNPAALLKAVEGGLRPKISASWPKPIGDLISSCWRTNPSDRPDIVHVLSELIDVRDNHGEPGAKRITSGKYWYDVFLSHNWGEDGKGRDNHTRVSTINRELVTSGLVTWFDSNELRGDIYKGMADGIDYSRVVVCFVTADYLTKASGNGKNGEADNCYREMSHAARTHIRGGRIIAVVMEPEVANTAAWRGLAGSTLGSQLYCDLSHDVGTKEWDDAMADLVSKIAGIDN